MNVNINTVKFKADKRLVDFVSDKVGKLSSLYEGVIGGDVTLKLDNSESRENKIAEIRLIIRGNDLYAKKQSKSFEEATDNAIDALKRQLTRHKEKVRGR
ncbi:MAG: ribosome-associated translation inhibitor RaiA [Bacteroidales bacterium]|nr:ribosome-associated translation inhibitor RaiA [Bacteroidales bacterium]